MQAGTPLPDKPVVLTFDDGNRSDFSLLYPLLEKYDMCAVLSIIGQATDKFTKEQTENPKATYPNMTWQQVKELHESGRCEIQSHGYDVHGKNGAGKRNGESAEIYHARLLQDLRKLHDRCETELEWSPTTFTYPLGVVSKGAQAVLNEMGFVASLSCQEGINTLRQGEPDGLWLMKRVNRAAGRSAETILQKLGQ